MSLLRTILSTVNTRARPKCTLQACRSYSTEESEEKTGGYAKAYEKFESITQEPKEDHSFPALLKNSKIIDLGDSVNKVVIGKIFHVIEDDLYIDFGWKFHCVCSRPKNKSSSYVRGTKVRILIKDLELSSKFLGFEKDLTLLEADCVLLGLWQDRSKQLT